MQEWNFLTTHGQVLSIIATQPFINTSEIASAIGVNKSRVRKVMSDLITDEFVSRSRDGRKFRYQINHNMSLSDEKRSELEILNYLELLFSRRRK